jgi:hypothetical protein
MLKIIFWLFVIVNGVLYGFHGGLWGPQSHERHEPERLSMQLHAEKLALVGPVGDEPPPVPAPVPAPVDALTPEEQVTPAEPAPSVASQNPTPAAPSVSAPVPTPLATTAAVTPNQVSTAEVVAPVVAPAKPEPSKQTPSPSDPAKSEPALEKPVLKSAASPAVSAEEKPKSKPLACFEFAYFADADGKKFEAAISKLALHGKLSQRSAPEVVSYMVHVGTTDGRVGAEKKAAELRRQNVDDFYIIPGTYAITSLRWNISLGVFKTEKAAKSFVADMNSRGVKGLKITPRTSGVNRIVYQLREVDPQAKERLSKMMSSFQGQQMRQCQ